MKIWIVGDNKSEDGSAWELIGVFDSEDKADAACTKPNHCYWPDVLNERASDETTTPPGIRYPRFEEQSDAEST
jgi:hypothetical protein